MSKENSEFEKRKERSKNILLPRWFLNTFPANLPWTTISFHDGFFHVSHDDSVFSDVIEAYTYASHFEDEYQIVLHPSINGHGGEFRFGVFYCDNKDNELPVQLVSTTTQDILGFYENIYLSWITDVSVEYNTDPDNFMKAHKWLNFHPVLWLHKDKTSLLNWETSGGINCLTVNVWANPENNEPGVFMEAKVHKSSTGYTSCQRDPFTMTYEPTYEKAIIELAKKLNQRYDLDGYERQ